MTKVAVSRNGIDIAENSYLKDVFRRFSKHKLAMVSLVLLIMEILLVIALPKFLHLDPYTSD